MTRLPLSSAVLLLALLGPLFGAGCGNETTSTGTRFSDPNGAAVTVLEVPPDAPSGLVATVWTPPPGALAFPKIMLSWVDNSDDETAFVIERSEEGHVFAEYIGDLPPDTTAFTDFDLTTGHCYYYRVRARNSAGDSEPSDAVGRHVP